MRTGNEMIPEDLRSFLAEGNLTLRWESPNVDTAQFFGSLAYGAVRFLRLSMRTGIFDSSS
jgi:hypothetical protein